MESSTDKTVQSTDPPSVLVSSQSTSTSQESLTSGSTSSSNMHAEPDVKSSRELLEPAVPEAIEEWVEKMRVEFGKSENDLPLLIFNSYLKRALLHDPAIGQDFHKPAPPEKGSDGIDSATMTRYLDKVDSYWKARRKVFNTLDEQTKKLEASGYPPAWQIELEVGGVLFQIITSCVKADSFFDPPQMA